MSCKSCPGPGPDCRCGRTAYGKQLRRDLRREYERLTTRQLELPMGFLDDLFDKVEAGLGMAESLQTKDEPPAEDDPDGDVIDVPPDANHKEWERSWTEPVEWGVADGPAPQPWHAFRKQSPVCQTPGVKPGKKTGVLAPGRVIPACTGCIIGVSNV